MPLLLPALAGGAVMLAFLLGSGKSDAKVEEELDTLDDDEKDALKTTAAAVAQEDWMLAVAEAIKSNSEMAMREVAEALKKAGLKEEAADLAEVAKETAAKKKAAKKPAAPKSVPVLAKPKPTTAVKPTTKVTTKPSAKSVEDAKAKEAQARKEYEARKAKEAADKKAKDAAAKKKAEAQKLKDQAAELKKHLASTGRYKENREYVTAYQKNNKLNPDGMYGPATARSFWSLYKLVPVNPYYWATSTASKDTAAYRTFLDSIKADAPKHAAEVDKLKGTVGR